MLRFSYEMIFLLRYYMYFKWLGCGVMGQWLTVKAMVVSSVPSRDII